MRKKGLIYNIESCDMSDGYKVIARYTDDGKERAPKYFLDLLDALFWIASVNMHAHHSSEAIVNIKL